MDFSGKLVNPLDNPKDDSKEESYKLMYRPSEKNDCTYNAAVMLYWDWVLTEHSYHDEKDVEENRVHRHNRLIQPFNPSLTPPSNIQSHGKKNNAK